MAGLTFVLHSYTLLVCISFKFVEGQPPTSDLDKLKDYCGFETFHPKCWGKEVIVLNAAVYGRRQLGRCVKVSDFEELGEQSRYIGCYTDVISLVDARCSGKKECEIRVPDPVLQQATACPLPSLLTYMEASYSCIEVVEEDRSCAVLVTPTPVHIAKPITSSSSGRNSNTGELHCGTRAQPWLLEAPAGQRIKISLLDFTPAASSASLAADFMMKDSSRASISISSSSSVMAGNCEHNRPLYGYVLEKPSGSTNSRKNASICGGAGRLGNAFVSASNAIEVVLATAEQQQKQTSEVANFILRLESIGCTDLVPPEDAWIKREDDKIIIGCYTSRQTWQLRCQDGRWIGVISNCTQKSLDFDIGKNGFRTSEQSSSTIMSYHEVAAVVAISFAGLAVCLVIVCCAVVCLHRFYARSSCKERLLIQQKGHAQVDNDPTKCFLALASGR